MVLRHFKVEQVIKIDATFQNSLDLCEYRRYTPSGCQDIGIRRIKVCGKDSIHFLPLCYKNTKEINKHNFSNRFVESF